MMEGASIFLQEAGVDAHRSSMPPHRTVAVQAATAPSGVHATAIVPPPVRVSRDLFYELVRIVANLHRRRQWRVYLTGTEFSMRNIMLSASPSTSTRCGVQDEGPRLCTSVDDMVAILSHYWDLDVVLFSPVVRDELVRFRAPRVSVHHQRLTQRPDGTH